MLTDEELAFLQKRDLASSVAALRTRVGSPFLARMRDRPGRLSAKRRMPVVSWRERGVFVREGRQDRSNL